METKSLHPTLKWLVLSLLVLGIFFRFNHLDRKVYWHDEVHSSLRISGSNYHQMLDELFNNSFHSPEDLLKFQRLSPDSDLKDVLENLVEHPEHPPLYYLLARFWLQIFGSSVTAIRALSVVFSLLLFPAIYWLAWELWQNSTISWLAIALISVSPFHVLYAQEARQYSLWSLTTALATAALLRGMQTRQRRAWFAYTVALTATFYTSLLSALVAISHAVYVVFVERWKWSQNVRNFLIAGTIAFVAFIPWLLIFISRFTQVQSYTSWTKIPQPFVELATFWGVHLTALFFDTGLSLFSFWNYLAIAILWSLVAYGLYITIKESPLKIWLLLLLLIVIPAAALVLPDLILGGRRSRSTRYFVPCFLSIQLAIAYLFASRLYYKKLLQTKIWSTVFMLIITSGVISCTISTQAEAWWNKQTSHSTMRIADTINHSKNPLIICAPSGTNLGQAFSLSYLLDSKVHWLFVIPPTIPKIPSRFSNIFVFHPTPDFLELVEETVESDVQPLSYY